MTSTGSGRGPSAGVGRGVLSGLARAAGWHRRLLAAGLAAGAVAAGLHALEPRPPHTVDVLVAGTDLAGGTVLSGADVRPAALPADSAPRGALSAPAEVEGRVLAAPVRAGEPLTDVRLVGAALVDGWGRGTVATPVRVADPGVTALVRPGDVVDLLAAPTDGSAARVVAARVPVLTVPAADDGGLHAEGALLVVGTSAEQAARLAAAAVTARVSLVLRSH